MFKQNKGITLVALVITIIVLLILAGVSISLVVGDNGILTKANSAKNDTEKADAEAAINMALAELTADYYTERYNNNSSTEMHEYLTSTKVNAAIQNAGYVTGDPYTYTAGTNGGTATVGIKASSTAQEYTCTLTITDTTGTNETHTVKLTSIVKKSS